MTDAPREADAAYESNPLLARLLEADVRLFVNVKTALTGIGLVLLLPFSHAVVVRGITVGGVLYLACGMYLCLIGYERLLLGWWAG